MHALGVLILALLPQNDEVLKVIGPSPGVVRLGESSVVQIVVEGRSAKPARPAVPTVDGLQISVQGPSSRTQTMFDGRGMRTTVSVTYSVVIRPLRVGEFEIPSFRLNTGTREQVVRALSLRAVRDVRGKDQGFFGIDVSTRRVYVHEPVRFVFDYGVDTRLDIAQRQRHHDIEVLAPWTEDMIGAVEVKDETEFDGQVAPLILNGQHLDAYYTQTARDGQTYHRFRFSRTFMPTRPGKLELDGPVLRFAVRTRGRDAFGFTTSSSKDYYVYGDAIEIEVLPLPDEGRPASFSGGVGRFTVSAEVDTPRVKVGDSIKLILTIRGEGNTEFMAVPELDELPGFHKFGENETRKPDQIVVTYDLTPLEATVDRLPAVEWSYFDTTPGVERYVEVSTEPIPIEVVPLSASERLSVLPGEDDGAVVAGVDDIYDIKPIDSSAPAPEPSRRSVWVSAALFVAPWLLCGLIAGFVRVLRRRAADVVGQRARNAAKTFHRALATGADAGDALAAYLADRLGVPPAAIIGPDLRARLLDAGADEELANDLVTALERSAASRYGGVDELGGEQASELVRRTDRAALSRASLALLLAVVVGLGAPATAQDPAAAERAYRARDYDVAVREYRRATEANPDGRLLYNLGNALFRSGRIAEALVAYESARLRLPRDAELLRNIDLAEQRLELGSAEGEPFLEALDALRRQFTASELLWFGVGCHVIAALGLWFGRRVLRWVGIAALVPGALIATEMLWFAPNRAPEAIVIEPRVDVTSEPDASLEPVLKVREGVAVDVLGRSGEWARIRVGDRSGYVPDAAIRVIR